MRLAGARDDLVAVCANVVRGGGVRPVLLGEPCPQVQFDTRHLGAGARQLRFGCRDAVAVAVPERDADADIGERLPADRPRARIEQLAVVARAGAHHQVGIRFLPRPHDRRGCPRHCRFGRPPLRAVAQQGGERHRLVEGWRERVRIGSQGRGRERRVAHHRAQLAPDAPLVVPRRCQPPPARHARRLRPPAGPAGRRHRCWRAAASSSPRRPRAAPVRRGSPSARRRGARRGNTAEPSSRPAAAAPPRWRAPRPPPPFAPPGRRRGGR